MCISFTSLSLPPSAVNTQSTFRRQVVRIQPSDVIITNIENNARGELEFVMYIQVAGGDQVLAVEALESAVQVTVFLCLVLYLFTIIRCETSRC